MMVPRLALMSALLFLPQLASAQGPKTPNPYPPGLTARAVAMTAACRATGGKPINGDRPFVYSQYDLTGDGRPEYILDEAGFGCSGKAGLFVTPTGAPLQVFDGATGASLYRGLAYTFQVTKDRGPRLLLTLRGPACSPNAMATTTCQRPLTWNAATRAFTGAPQLAAAPPTGQTKPSPTPTPAPAGSMTLTAAEKAAAFRAAGFKLEGGQWKACGDPGTLSYSPGAIEAVTDLNADGRPEVVITEGGTYCFGNTGTGFVILTKAQNGYWTIVAQETGMFIPLKTRANGWLEIMVGGPGFTHPVIRFNGRAYAAHRQMKE